MTEKFLLNKFMVMEHVKSALKEDIGYGDISTDFLCGEDSEFSVYLKTREDGIFCGRMPIECVFELLGGVSVEYFE